MIYFYFIYWRNYHLIVFFVCSCSQKSNISNLPTASLCCAGSITYKCIGKIQNMKVYLYRPQFENVHFLWVNNLNNASTSFFTHFYSINFIYTAYFAWNYFIFTSYMKYFCLWSITIVTEVQGHHWILSNSRSLDIGYFERKYTFWTIVPHLHIQHFVYRYHTWHNVEKWMS